jgi:hypothetical protein
VTITLSFLRTQEVVLWELLTGLQDNDNRHADNVVTKPAVIDMQLGLRMSAGSGGFEAFLLELRSLKRNLLQHTRSYEMGFVLLIPTSQSTQFQRAFVQISIQLLAAQQ